jgi:hypothetical protein
MGDDRLWWQAKGSERAALLKSTVDGLERDQEIRAAVLRGLAR